MKRAEYLGEFEEIVLLAIRAVGDRAYGMEVRRAIEASTGRSVSIGAVYATIERLASKGFLREATAIPPDRDARARLFFQLTAAGAQALVAAERARQGLRLRAKSVRP